MIGGYFSGSFDGVHTFTARLSTLDHYAGDLIGRWAAVLIEDNRRGVLAGLDRHDRQVIPTNYRNSFVQAGRDKPTTVQEVKGWLVNVSGGPGPGFKPGAGWDLTKKEYREQSGPPLAPRGMASRIISNYTVAPMHQPGAGGMVGVEGGWDDVLNDRGEEFLQYHFDGTGMHRGGAYASWTKRRGVGRGKNMPRRDMAGLRKWGKDQAKKELREWVRELMEVQQGQYFSQMGHDAFFIPSRRYKWRKKDQGGTP